MRTKEFFIRTGIFLPMAVFGILFFLMLVGVAADLLGAQNAFYCTVYCKVSVGLISAVVATVIYCQAKACWRNK